MARQDFRFFDSLRVRWSEVDRQGIVFNGHYLTYFDVAFTEYWRETGLPDVLAQAREGHELFVRKAALEYLAPAHFDDLLSIGVRCAEIGRSSIRFALEIYRDDALLIVGELVYVHANTAAHKGVAVPDTWRVALASLDPAVVLR